LEGFPQNMHRLATVPNSGSFGNLSEYSDTDIPWVLRCRVLITLTKHPQMAQRTCHPGVRRSRSSRLRCFDARVRWTAAFLRHSSRSQTTLFRGGRLPPQYSHMFRCISFEVRRAVSFPQRPPHITTAHTPGMGRSASANSYAVPSSAARASFAAGALGRSVVLCMFQDRITSDARAQA